MYGASGRASGGELQPESDRKFRRFALCAALAALALVVIVGAVFSVRAYRSPRNQVERMTLDVSRALDKILRSSDDLATPIDELDEVAKRWRAVFKQWENIPLTLEEDIFRLQELQDKVLPKWREDLNSANSAQTRLLVIKEDVLREQSNWPPPPPLPFVLVLSDGVLDFCSGAVEGVAWPFLVGKRVREIYVRDPNWQWQSWKVRYALFPYTAAGLSFGRILGFGILVTLAGYGLCYLGMRINAGFFSLLGLLYYLYAIVYSVFVTFLLFGLLS